MLCIFHDLFEVTVPLALVLLFAEQCESHTGFPGSCYMGCLGKQNVYDLCLRAYVSWQQIQLEVLVDVVEWLKSSLK